MPKIPWSPAPRPERIKPAPEPEPFAPVSQDRCENCVGVGKLYSQREDGAVEIECWVCKGTGSALPVPNAPNDPFRVADPFAPEPTPPNESECGDPNCPDQNGGRHEHQPGSTVYWID